MFKAFEVFPNLFQGSQIFTLGDGEAVEKLGIKVVIDLEGGFDLSMDFLTAYLYWPIHDVPWLPNQFQLAGVAAFGFVFVSKGEKVLVHCKQGLNRSGLVSACIMACAGMEGPNILKAINAVIPFALWNPVFRLYVDGLNK